MTIYDEIRYAQCNRCGCSHPSASFYYLRGMGLMCSDCVLEVTGCATIQQFQAERFSRLSNPREG